MMDTVNVVWGNGFSNADMLLLIRDTRVTKRFARECVEPDADDADGEALVGVAGGQRFSPLGKTWYKCYHEICDEDSNKVSVQCCS